MRSPPAGDLDGYHLLHAARADLLRRLGRDRRKRRRATRERSRWPPTTASADFSNAGCAKFSRRVVGLMARSGRARSPDRRGPRGHDFEPAQGAVPAGGLHQARSRALLPGRRRRRAARRRRPAQRAGPLSERHRRRVLLSEARARFAAAVDRGRGAALPVRPHRRGSRAARRRGAGVDGEPRLPRAASASGARRRSRSSRRAARRSRSRAGRRVAADSRGRARRARHARRLRARRLAEDVRLARHAHLRAHRAALDVRPGAPRRAGARARGRAPRAGARHQQVVEGRAARRVPRLQPERQGPDDRRAYSVRPTPDARVSAPLTWDEIDSCEPDDFTLATMPARFAAIGDRHAAIDEHPARSTRCWSSRRGRSATGSAMRRGRRTTRSSRASRRASSRRGRRSSPKLPLIEIAPRAGRKTMRWPDSSAGRRAIPTPPRTCSRPTCSSTPCAAAFRPGRASASISSTCRPQLRPPQEPLDPDEAPNDLARCFGSRARGVATPAQRLMISSAREILE